MRAVLAGLALLGAGGAQSPPELDAIHMNPDSGQVSLEAVVLAPRMPVEYLLVGKAGATHESLFLTQVEASKVNAALQEIGLTKGTNVTFRDRKPAPTEEELLAGAVPYEIFPPAGDGVYLYAEWMEGEELRRYRVEDLILNTKRNKSAKRVRWVYLGSRLLPAEGDRPESLAADLEQNLVSVSYFTAGNQILANPDLDAAVPHIHIPNPWLLPEKGTRVRIIFSKERLEKPWHAGK